MKKLFYLFINIIAFLSIFIAMDICSYYVNYKKLSNNLAYIKEDISYNNGVTNLLKEKLNDLKIDIAYEKEFATSGELYTFTISSNYKQILSQKDKIIKIQAIVLLGY